MQPPNGFSIRSVCSLFLVFFAITLYLPSCTQNSAKFEISKNEKKWMTGFFHDLLIVDGGMYTLLGSKPITRISLENFTEEEKLAYYASLSKEELDNAQIIENYALPKNWEKWKAISARYPFKRYMLFETSDEDQMRFIYFVNLLQTAITIQENYETFLRVVKYDFNPLEVVLEIQNKDSKFWNAIQNDSLLWGLLFGYGKVNSYAFFWKHGKVSSKVADFIDSLKGTPNKNELTGIVKFSLKNFEIPSFISFEGGNQTMHHYEQEKDAIQKLYKGQDFLEFTLDTLTK